MNEKQEKEAVQLIREFTTKMHDLDLTFYDMVVIRDKYFPVINSGRICDPVGVANTIVYVENHILQLKKLMHDLFGIKFEDDLRGPSHIKLPKELAAKEAKHQTENPLIVLRDKLVDKVLKHPPNEQQIPTITAIRSAAAFLRITRSELSQIKGQIQECPELTQFLEMLGEPVTNAEREEESATLEAEVVAEPPAENKFVNLIAQVRIVVDDLPLNQMGGTAKGKVRRLLKNLQEGKGITKKDQGYLENITPKVGKILSELLEMLQPAGDAVE